MKSFKELMEIVAPDVKTDLKGLDATSFAKKHGKSKTEIKNTFESAEEKVPEPGREAVGGRFTSRPPKSVIRPAPQVASEEVEQIEEGRPSQRHPLEGHEYHKKTDAELVYIAKDAHKAAEAMKSHNTTAENKYRDQANDSATVRYFRQKNGMPDWYKKKYGHMKEDIERVEEMDKSQTPPGRDGGYQFAPGPKVSKKDIEAVKKNPAKHLTDLFAKEYAKKKMKEEVVDEAKDPKEYGYEGDMAMNQLQTIMRHAEYLMDMMKPDTDLPEWVQSKITLAADYIQTSCDYMTSEMKEEVKTPPFAGPYKKAKDEVKDKSGAVHTPMSRAKDLAKKAAMRQAGMKKESIQESRRADIIREAMKAAKEKVKKEKQTADEDKFIADPELNSKVIKTASQM